MTYSCFVIRSPEGFVVDVEIREGKRNGAYFSGTFQECEEWKAQYLNELDSRPPFGF